MTAKEAAYKEAFFKQLFSRLGSGVAKAAPMTANAVGKQNLAETLYSTRQKAPSLFDNLKNSLFSAQKAAPATPTPAVAAAAPPRVRAPRQKKPVSMLDQAQKHISNNMGFYKPVAIGAAAGVGIGAGASLASSSFSAKQQQQQPPQPTYY